LERRNAIDDLFDTIFAQDKFYENEDFRIFEVGAPGTEKAASADPADPIYDITQFRPHDQPNGSLELDVSAVLKRRNTHRQQIFLARLLAQMGQNEAALSAYAKSFSTWPADDGVKAEAARLAARARGGFPPPP